MRTVGYALGYILLLALSVSMFFMGEIAWGIVAVVLVGGGGVAYLFLSRPVTITDTPAAPPRRHGRLSGMDRFTREPAGLVFPGSRLSALVVLAAATVFVVVGVLLMYFAIFNPPSRPGPHGGPVTMFIAGIVSVIFFSYGGIVALVALIRGGNGIALVADGVYFRAPGGRAWVAWDDLKSVRGGVDGIRFRAHSPERITLTGMNRWRQEKNRRKHGMDARYPALLITGAPAPLLDQINHFRTHPEARTELRHPGCAGQPAQ